MSFLDNLESNLKALESRSERDAETLEREAAARAAARSIALQSAAHAEALGNGPFTDGLLTACRIVGHRTRILVRPTWVDSTLRLEAGARKLELRPTPDGVLAVFFEAGNEQESTPIDLSSDPLKLVEKWLDGGGRSNPLKDYRKVSDLPVSASVTCAPEKDYQRSGDRAASHSLDGNPRTPGPARARESTQARRI